MDISFFTVKTRLGGDVTVIPTTETNLFGQLIYHIKGSINLFYLQYLAEEQIDLPLIENHMEKNTYILLTGHEYSHGELIESIETDSEKLNGFLEMTEM